jgi:hypothetical protein
MTAPTHDWNAPPGDCPGCKAARQEQAAQDAALDITEATGPCPGPCCQPVEEVVGIPLPEFRAIHHCQVQDYTWSRIGTDPRDWIIVRNTADIQAGDGVVLYASDDSVVAAGEIEHVAHPEVYSGLRKGYVILTLKNLKPARAEASE